MHAMAAPRHKHYSTKLDFSAHLRFIFMVCFHLLHNSTHRHAHTHTHSSCFWNVVAYYNKETSFVLEKTETKDLDKPPSAAVLHVFIG